MSDRTNAAQEDDSSSPVPLTGVGAAVPLARGAGAWWFARRRKSVDGG
ncbi:hypothetical protein ACIOJD_19045 [Streptomyces sp. NPDC088116]